MISKKRKSPLVLLIVITTLLWGGLALAQTDITVAGDTTVNYNFSSGDIENITFQGTRGKLFLAGIGKVTGNLNSDVGVIDYNQIYLEGDRTLTFDSDSAININGGDLYLYRDGGSRATYDINGTLSIASARGMGASSYVTLDLRDANLENSGSIYLYYASELLARDGQNLGRIDSVHTNGIIEVEGTTPSLSLAFYYAAGYRFKGTIGADNRLGTLTANGGYLEGTVYADTVNAGGNLTFYGTSTIDGTLNLGNYTLTVTEGNSTVKMLNIAGSGSVDGDRILNITTGATLGSSAGESTAALNFTGGDVSIQGGTYTDAITLNSTGTQAITGGMFGSNINVDQDITISGGTFNGTMDIDGAATVAIDGTQTFSAVTGSGGMDGTSGGSADHLTVAFGAGGYSGNLGATQTFDTVTLNASASAYSGTINATTVGQNGALELADSADINAQLDLTGNHGDLTVTGSVAASSLLLDGDSSVIGTGSLTVDGSSDVTISAGTFGGTTTLIFGNGGNSIINGGTFHSVAFSSAAGTNQINGGTFNGDVAINQNAAITAGTFNASGTITVADEKILTLDTVTIGSAVTAEGATSGGVNLTSGDSQIGALTLGGVAAVTGASNTLTIHSANTSTLNSSGTNDVNLIFAGSGDVNVQAGTFNGDLSFNSSGTQTIFDGTFGGAIDIDNACTLTVNTAGSYSLSGISGGGSLTKTGNGTLTLSGANSYSGGTTISAGALAVESDFSSNGLTIANGAELQVNGGTTTWAAGDLATGQTLTVGGGTLNLTQDFDRSGTPDGTFNFNSGTVQVSAGTTQWNAGALVSSQTVTVSGGSWQTDSIAFSSGNAGTLNLGSGDVTVSGDADFSDGTFTFTGGTLNVGGTLSGVTTVTSTQTVNLTASSGQWNRANLIVDGDLGIQSGGTLTLTGGLTANGNVDVAGNATVNGLAVGTGGSLTLNGGTMALTGDVDFSALDGTFTHSSGTIQVAGGTTTWDAGSAALSATKNLTLNGGTLKVTTQDFNTTQNGFTATGGSFEIDNGRKLTTTTATLNDLNINNSGNVEFSQGSTGTYSGQITGGGTLTKTGNGTLTLSGANSYSGGTTIDSGTISISNDNQLGDAAGGLTLNGGTLQCTSDFTSARVITVNGTGNTLDTNGSAQLSGNIVGTGTLTIDGGATLDVSGTSSVHFNFTGSGSVAVNAGIYTGDITLASTGTQTITGGTFGGDINVNQNTTISDGTFDASKTVTVANEKVLTLDTATIAGVISAEGATSGGIHLTSGDSQINTLTLSGAAAVTGSGNILTIHSDATSTLNTSGTCDANLEFAGSGDVAVQAGTYSGDLFLNSTGTQTISGGVLHNIIATEDLMINGGTSSGNLTASSGTITVNQDFTASQGTTIAGTATLDITAGQTLSSDITLSGGTLCGTGTIGGTFIQNGGTLKPGNSIGTIAIDGDATLNDTEIEIHSNGSCDQIASNGTVTFADDATMRVLQEPTDPGSLVAGTTYDIVMASNPIIDADNVTFISEVGYDITGMLTNNNRTFQIMLLGTISGDTPNNQALVNYLFQLSAAGQNPTAIFAALTADSNQQLAMEKLTGESLATNQQVMTQMNLLSTNILLSHIRPTFDFSNKRSNPFALNRTFNGIARAQSDPTHSTFNGWSTAYGLGGQIFGNTSAASASMSLGGMITGIDIQSQSSKLGMFYSYNYASANVSLLDATTQIEDHFFGGYLTNQSQLSYWLAGFGFGFDNYRTRRHLHIGSGASTLNEIASSLHSGWQAMVYGEAGLNYTYKKLYFQPYFGLQYAYLRQDPFEETGAAVSALRVSDMTMDALRSHFGARANMALPTSDGDSTIELRSTWIHQMLDPMAPLMNAGLVSPSNTSSFAITGATTGRDWVWLGTGLKWKKRSGITFYANYDILFNECQTLHTGSGGLNFTW